MVAASFHNLYEICIYNIFTFKLKKSQFPLSLLELSSMNHEKQKIRKYNQQKHKNTTELPSENTSFLKELRNCTL